MSIGGRGAARDRICVAGRSARTRAGVTLTETLVVLGVILVLLSFLLPTILSSRRSARHAMCLYRMHEFGAAITQYQSHNRLALPLAGASRRTWIDPNTKERLEEGDQDLVPIATALEPYLKTEKDLWSCPMQAAARNVPLQPWASPGYERLGGFMSWTPGYRYLSTLQMLPWVDSKQEFPMSVAKKLRLKAWAVRNVAGLRPTVLKTISPVQDGRIAVMVERSTVYHSARDANSFELDADRKERGDFKLNVLWLDGSVTTVQFADTDGLLKQLHGPIRQKAGGVELSEKYPEAYVLPLPSYEEEENLRRKFEKEKKDGRKESKRNTDKDVLSQGGDR